MCGIFAAFNRNRKVDEQINENLESVQAAIQRRGPDNHGFRILANNHLAMVHTRLAIQDLSSQSNQPISHNSDKDSAMIYNGEIYNTEFLTSKYKLYDDKIIKDSDTSILLSLLGKYVPERFLGSIDGMIAFCFYDSKTNSLWFYRDHTGQKPLYFYYELNPQGINEKVMISSSIGAFKAYENGKRFEHDTSQLEVYLHSKYLEPGKTVYKDVRSCIPGCLYRYNCKNGILEEINILEDSQHCEENLKYKKEKALDEMKSVLIGSRDFGILLSGGVDSSFIMTKLARSGKISNAYTMVTPGMHDSIEIQNAVNISRSLNVEHTLVDYSIDEVTDLALNIYEIIDHPNPDPSILPTTLVGRYASKRSTVLLTGDGADEYFGGYNRHVSMVKKFGYLYPRMPEKLKKALLLYYLLNFTHESIKYRTARYLSDKKLVEKILPNCSNSLLSDICKIDAGSYMHQHTLPKTDRALMYSSVEGRAPFLLRSVRELGNYTTRIKALEPGKKYLKDQLTEINDKYQMVKVKKGFSAELKFLFLDELFAKAMKVSCEAAIDIFKGESKKYAVYINKNLHKNQLTPSLMREIWHMHTIVDCHRYLN